MWGKWPLASGELVEDRNRSRVYPGVTETLLKEALGQIAVRFEDLPPDKFIVRSVDFGRKIGQKVVIRTTERDRCVYAVRLMPNGQPYPGHSRLVIGRQPRPTRWLTAMLLRRGPIFVLQGAYLGPQAEKEPWDQHIHSREEMDRCWGYWMSHAWLYQEVEIVPETETDLFPW